jgi:hypothetical protein
VPESERTKSVVAERGRGEPRPPSYIGLSLAAGANGRFGFLQLLLEHLDRFFELRVAAFEEVLRRVVHVHVRRHAVVLEVVSLDVP